MASTARLNPEQNPLRRQETAPVPVLALPVKRPFVGQNRRFLPRVAKAFRVRFADQIMEGIDLSFHGMMCRSHDVFWPGNHLDLEIYLPDESEPIATCAKVMELTSHRGELAMRLTFEDISPTGRRRIALWMARSS